MMDLPNQSEYRELLQYLTPQERAELATLIDGANLDSDLLIPVPDLIDWGESEFFIVETGRPIRFEPHQKTILRLMAQQDRQPDGRYTFRYTTWLYSTIKKSGKTTISALVARWAAETWGKYQEIYNLGNKLKQAKERAFRKVKQSIELGPPAMRDSWDIQATQMTHRRTGSIIQALPISDAGEAGGNQSLTVWTELWGFEYDEALRMWDELQPVPTRAGRSVRFIDTYAGYEGESDLLKGLWNLILNDDGSLAHGVIRLHDTLPVYAMPQASLVAYIDQGLPARRMPWQRGKAGRAYYKQQEKIERKHNFLRLHHNFWVSSVNSLVPLETWDQLTYHRAKLPDNISVWLAADASIRRDCAALTAVTTLGDLVLELNTWIWQPDRGDLDYDQTLIPQVRTAIKRFNVLGVTFDEWQLHSDMSRLAVEYPDIPFMPFSQAAERVRADTNLLWRITNGKLRHSGAPQLRSHVQNAAAKDVIHGEAIRIVKRTSRQTATQDGETVSAKPIDGIIALSMAAWFATELFEDIQTVWDNSVRVRIGNY